MKKKFLLLLTVTPLVSQTSELPYQSSFSHPSAPSSFDPFAQPAAQDSFEDWKKQTLEESQYQLKLRAEFERQQKRNPGPPRTVPISRSVPDQVFHHYPSSAEEASRGHRRQRSASDPSIFEQPEERDLPGYSLLHTQKEDSLLSYANQELEESIEINKELTALLQKELTKAAERHAKVTSGMLSPGLPKRTMLVKSLDIIRRRSKAKRHEETLKKQTKESAKTEQESREAIIPLVVQATMMKTAMNKLKIQINEAGRKSHEQHTHLLGKTRSSSEEFSPRERSQSIAISQRRSRTTAWDE